MDVIEVELITVAREIARSSQLQLAQTAAEMAELERQLLQLKTQWEGQLHAGAIAYRPRLGAREYACPNCWIIYGQSFVLTPVMFNSSSESVLRCQSCGRDFGLITKQD